MYAFAKIAGAVVVVLALATLDVVEQPVSAWAPTLAAAIIARLAFLACAALTTYFTLRKIARKWRTDDISLAPRTPVPDIRFVDPETQRSDIFSAVVLVHERYSASVIGAFVRMLTNPRFRVRITEQAELLGTSVRTHVTTDYAMSATDRERLNKDAKGSFPVPLLNEIKGAMTDNLDAVNSDGSGMSLLSQREVTGLVVLALEALFYVTFDRAPADTPADTQQTAALLTLQRIVSRLGRLEPADHSDNAQYTRDKLRADFRDAVKYLTPVTVDRLAQFEDFCWYFVANDVVVVDTPIPEGNRFIVKYSKTNPLDSQLIDKGNLRTRLGLVPHMFRLPLNLAFEAESYHFRMDIGESQYVRDHYITRQDGTHIDEDDLRSITNGGHVRVQHGTALPYAHLYTRGLHKAPTVRDFTNVVKFRETPPGALGATTMVAAVSAVLIAILTFIPPMGSGPNADTAALLLAVPLFAATLVGHSIERVQRSSLTTFAGLVITGVTAFVGGAVFGLIPGKTSISDVNMFGWFVVPSVNVVGVVLSAIGVANVIHLTWRHRYCAKTYLEMLETRTPVDVSRSA